MKVSELLAKAAMQPVPKARNLLLIGWADGYMPVRFRSKPTIWIYGPAIPEVERDKIIRVPFPDRQFNCAIKNKYQCFKVGA